MDVRGLRTEVRLVGRGASRHTESAARAPHRRGTATGRIQVITRSIALTLCLLAAPALAGSVLEGTVTHVRDGDTIEIGETAIRLSGLHAPEMDEAGGREARAFMVELVGSQPLRCELTGRKSYGREIGTCALDGDDIAGLLVAAGLGRDCPRFSGGKYRHLETDAGRELRLPRYCRP